MIRYFLIGILCVLGLNVNAQDVVVIQSVHLKTNDSVLVYKPATYQ